MQSTIFSFFIILLFVLLILISLIAILNTLTFPRLKSTPVRSSASQSVPLRLSVSESVSNIRSSVSKSVPLRLSVSESVDNIRPSASQSVPVRLSVSESVDNIRLSAAPSASLLIPARNESAVIENTLRALAAQTYPNYEILILDDHSTDNTTDLARSALSAPTRLSDSQSVDTSAPIRLSVSESVDDIRFSVLESADLPPGWKGKNWACHQLSQFASADILIFTDADVRWTPEALTAIVDEMTRTRADMLTIWPTQVTETWTERLVVPLMGFAIMAYLPVLAVHHIPWPVFAAANGQCLAFRRPAYEQIGGHAAVRDKIVEDMAFAYAIKRARLRLRMADGNALIQTRMYHNWSEVRDGYAKNILGGHANSIPFLLFSTLLHLFLFVFPWLWLPFAANPLLPALLILLGILPRALTAAATRQRPLDAIFMPISVILMTIISARAIYWHFTGGPRWKGRAYGKS